VRALTDRKHGGLLAAVLFSCVLGCAVGCSVRRGVEPRPAGTERPGLGDLTSAADRARLEVIAAARANASDDGSYRIGPDDLLDIRIPDLLEAQAQAAAPHGAQGGAEPAAVSGAPTFQQGVRVTGAGEVSLPLLGMVEAKGLTPTELEHEIARRLVAADILRSPHVSVLVAEYRSRVVAVSGSVQPSAAVRVLIERKDRGGRWRRVSDAGVKVRSGQFSANFRLKTAGLYRLTTRTGPVAAPALYVRAVRRATDVPPPSGGTLAS